MSFGPMGNNDNYMPSSPVLKLIVIASLTGTQRLACGCRFSIYQQPIVNYVNPSDYINISKLKSIIYVKCKTSTEKTPGQLKKKKVYFVLVKKAK